MLQTAVKGVHCFSPWPTASPIHDSCDPNPTKEPRGEKRCANTDLQLSDWSSQFLWQLCFAVRLTLSPPKLKV